MKRPNSLPCILAALLLFAAVFAFSAAPVSAASPGSVRVTVADFPVRLNGQVMNNDYAEYPCIVYNQITYVPMTYYDCRFLGLVTDWNQTTQTLKIDKSSVREPYHPTTRSAKNGPGTAEIVTYPVVVNGKAIDNRSEQYPLIVFRQVTYFPLTWRFCVDEFGWDYKYTNETGLAISASSGDAAVVAPKPESKLEAAERGAVISNFWAPYAAAGEAMANGDWNTAIANYFKALPAFLATQNQTNRALIYANIGQCFCNVGDYETAAECWSREADRWEEAASELRAAGDAVNAASAVQSAIAADRKASYVKSEITLYVGTTDASYSQAGSFSVPGIPSSGVLLGAYAEGDPAVHDPSGATGRRYWNDFTALTGKEHGVYLTYFHYGSDFSILNTHVTNLRNRNAILEIHLQPANGLSQVRNDAYLMNLAKAIGNSGLTVWLRFAGEMNLESTEWYDTPANYIAAFRTVANAIHQYAPNCAMVWAPNFFPDNNFADFYPGDSYVDICGISSYMNKGEASLDPLGEGVDRLRWSNQLDTFYSQFGHKPVVVVEGGCSYFDINTGADITSYAVTQLGDFYAYAPIRYPNLRGIVYFDAKDPAGRNFLLSSNPTVLSAYKNAIASSDYLTGTNASAAGLFYFPVTSAATVPNGTLTLASYVKYVRDERVARVDYCVGSTVIGSSKTRPYSVTTNAFAKAGSYNVTVNAYNASGTLLYSERFVLNSR